MSQPVDPHRGDPGHRYRQPHGEQPYPDQPYGQGPPHRQQPYGQPYGQQPYGQQPPYSGQAPGGQAYAAPGGHQAPARRHASSGGEAPVRRRAAGGPRRVPGVGLVLTLLGLMVQLLSFTVLSWVRLGAGQPGSTATPRVWQLVADHGAHGFGGWYVVAFSYPMAVLSIVLALASVFESVALKLIWAGLTVIGLGVLVVRYGFGPLSTDGPHLSTWQIGLVCAAVAALVVVIFVLRSAVSMFRRTAGLILLALAGVHIAAVYDLVKESGVEDLSIGAYGPALGYLLTAVAAFTGPRRVPGVS